MTDRPRYSVDRRRIDITHFVFEAAAAGMCKESSVEDKYASEIASSLTTLLFGGAEKVVLW